MNSDTSTGSREAADVLAAALHHDPGWTHVIPDPRSRQLTLRTLLGVAIRDASRYGNVVPSSEGGELTGVAVWMPPGTYPMSGWRSLRAAGPMTALAARSPSSVKAAAAFGVSIDCAFPQRPVWYLLALGVAEAQRGKGIAAQLIRPTLETADADGLPSYLETSSPRNVAYYERFGFALVDEFAPLAPGGPPMARMLREPR